MLLPHLQVQPVYEDLSCTLALLAAFVRHEPSLARLLTQQKVDVDVAGALDREPNVQAGGASRRAAAQAGSNSVESYTWVDALAGVLQVLPQAVPVQVQPMVHALELMQAMAVHVPQRVLGLLSTLPLLTTPAADMLRGQPATIPLQALPVFQVCGHIIVMVLCTHL